MHRSVIDTDRPHNALGGLGLRNVLEGLEAHTPETPVAKDTRAWVRFQRSSSREWLLLSLAS